MSLTKIFLYRITHIDNIPFILENGITHKNSVKASPNYINIGDVSYFTTFYDATKISTIERIIDFQSVKAVKWSGEGVPLDLKRKKQAEFLIKEDVSPDLITGFICYNESAGNELEALGIKKSRIKVSPSAYY